MIPTTAGATQWINSEPLSLAELRGRVVLVNFWTLTCINWLRTAPHIKAWAHSYRDDGLVVVGVHTPEFAFEQDIALVEQAVRTRELDYPIAIDNNYAVWNAFANLYWPAVYLIDRESSQRGQHFGEGSYDQVERVIQQLLGVDRPLTTPIGEGVEADADWPHLHSPETYVGHARATSFSSEHDLDIQDRQHYRLPYTLKLNHWALRGDWTVGAEYAELHQPGGSVAFRFLARDAHLVLSTAAREPTSFRVLLDGAPPGRAHGVDTDEHGDGVLREGRMYQLVRATDDVRERQLEITFSAPGVRAHAFTFG